MLELWDEPFVGYTCEILSLGMKMVKRGLRLTEYSLKSFQLERGLDVKKGDEEGDEK